MRLSMRFPAPWVLKYAPDEKVAAILPGDRIPSAVITYGPMLLLPDEPRSWQAQTVHSDLPPDSKVVIGRTIDVKTATGWPLRIVEAEVRTKTDAIIEMRLCGFYSFFEHTAAVIVRTQDRARMEALGNGLLDILASGRPDWSGDEVACLVDAWSFGGEPERAPIEPRAQELFLRGVKLGTAGDHAGAIEVWTRALELEPDQVDTIYNRGQARYRTKDFTGALADFERAVALAPGDLMIQRKVIQCLYALDRFTDGEAARAAFRTLWAASTDASVQRVHEFVFDQVAGDGFTMFVIETLRPRNPNAPSLLVMSGVDATDAALPATVIIETSQQARAAGTPFVVCVRDATKTRVVSTLKELPPYGELRQTALTLLRDALAPS